MFSLRALLHPTRRWDCIRTIGRCPGQRNKSLFNAEVHLLMDYAAAVFSSQLIANCHLQRVVIRLKRQELYDPAGDDTSWRAILRRDHRPRLALVNNLAALQDSGAYLELRLFALAVKLRVVDHQRVRKLTAAGEASL